MAEIKTAFIAFCNTHPAISAVFANRITAENVPDGQAFPYGVVNEVTSPAIYAHSGQVGRVASLQVDIFGETQAQADNAREVLRAALSGYSGQMGDVYAGRVFVADVRGNWDADLRRYRRILEINIGTND